MCFAYMCFVNCIDMNVFKRGSYTLSHKLLVLTGLWPFEKSLLVIVQRIGFLCLVMSIVVSEFMSLIKYRVTGDQIVFFATFLCNVGMVLVKYINIIAHQDKVKYVLETIDYDWNAIIDEKEIEILKRYAKTQRGNTLTRIFIVHMIVVLSSSAVLWPRFLDIVLPLNTSGPLYLIVGVKYSEDHEKHFFLISGHAFIAYLSGLVMITPIDSLYGIIVHHHCALFRIVSYRIKVAIDDTPETEHPRFGKSYLIYARICRALENYNTLVSMFEYTTSFTSVSCFIIIGLIVISSTVHMFQIVVLSHSTGELVHVFFYLYITFIMFLYSFNENYNGQIYMDHSLNVFHETYNTRWYTLPHRIQKLLLLVLQRTSKCCAPILAGVYVPSTQGFASMINTSISYFTVIYTVRYGS